ncbi:MAG: hypothetical protein EBZ36_11865 [Acidobacteria bacterium]|nr:hypothetical protein [Acidobacteriota bacterium]
MFRVAEEDNRKLTWGIRVGGFFFVWIGILGILNPVLMLFRWIPILGGMVEFGLSLVAFAIAAATSGAVIAYSWFRHRPNLSFGIAIGALGIAGLALLIRRLRQPDFAMPLWRARRRGTIRNGARKMRDTPSFAGFPPQSRMPPGRIFTIPARERSSNRTFSSITTS